MSPGGTGKSAYILNIPYRLGLARVDFAADKVANA